MTTTFESHTATGPRGSWEVLLDMVCGHPVLEEGVGPAGRTQLIVAATLGAVLTSGLWGLAAGSASWDLALSNLVKVPTALLFSGVAALPSGLLALKLSGAELSVRDLLFGVASALFAGGLVLGSVAPLLALYYHSSQWAGPLLATGSVVLAMLAAVWVLVRAVLHRLPEDAARLPALLPVLVLVGMQAAVLLQMAAVLPPILPDPTVFHGGIDQLMTR